VGRTRASVTCEQRARVPDAQLLRRADPHRDRALPEPARRRPQLALASARAARRIRSSPATRARSAPTTPPHARARTGRARPTRTRSRDDERADHHRCDEQPTHETEYRSWTLALATLLQRIKHWNATHGPRQQIDQQAELAVAGQEGLSGGIGDGGHAFGPNQLNDAGGVWTGRNQGLTPEQKNAAGMVARGDRRGSRGGRTRGGWRAWRRRRQPHRQRLRTARETRRARSRARSRRSAHPAFQHRRRRSPGRLLPGRERDRRRPEPRQPGPPPASRPAAHQQHRRQQLLRPVPAGAAAVQAERPGRRRLGHPARPEDRRESRKGPVGSARREEHHRRAASRRHRRPDPFHRPARPRRLH
jgi:hypothetical protein